MTHSTATTDHLALSVAGAAAKVGLTPATLRTWDRRYGMSPSVRTSGGHRRYNAGDLTRLRLAARMVDDGLPPAGATRAVASWTATECEERLALADSLVGKVGERAAKSGEADVDLTGRAGGGRAISMPEATAEQRGMARAAMSLDAQAVREIMTNAIADRGVVSAWNELASPTLRAIGDRWERTHKDVEVEHIASMGIQQALDIDTPAGLTGRPVTLSCTPQDQHGLALLALRAALFERGIPAIMLGTRLPPAALAAAAARLRPRAVVLWASMPGNADIELLQSIPRQRPPIRCYLAGPGWAAVELSGEAPEQLTSLEQALDVLAC